MCMYLALAVGWVRLLLLASIFSILEHNQCQEGKKERKEGTCPRQVGEKEGLHQTGVDRRTRQRQRSTDRREGRTQSKRRNNKECAFFYLLARA